MSNPRRIRRSAEQWREIINRFQHSPLNAPNFCSEQGIGYASFIKWNRRLESDGVAAEKLAEFVELTPPTPSAPQTQWDIELDLAPGIQLRIARGV